LFGTIAVIFRGGGGGGIDFFVCEEAFVESKIMRANAAAQKVIFPIEIFFSEMHVVSFSIKFTE